MQEVTCFHCKNVVHITPDADRCAVCGEDLKHLLAPETISAYFHGRANELVTRGDLRAALAEAERGLAYRASAELHLLAAILAQRLGQFDPMRQHVASIPVDDSLRPEAEWLLRAHQARQRALRDGSRTGRAGGRTASPDGATSTSLLDDLLGRHDGAQPGGRQRTRGLGPVVVALALIGLIAGGWFLLGRGSSVLATLMRGQEPAAHSADGALPPGLSTADAVEAKVTAPSLEGTHRETSEATPIPAVIQLTPVPTPTIPADVVAKSADPPALADKDPSPGVLIPAPKFDLKQWLEKNDHADLAELPITAQLRDGRLILQGIVHLDIQRRTLVELAKADPAIKDVSTVDLLLRPLATYTVQPGDTLWSIVYNIYGDVDRLHEFYQYNADVLPSADALSVGMELKVLPVN